MTRDNDLYARLKAFQENYIPFPPFVAAKNAIEETLLTYRNTGIAKHLVVLGEAGTGKTSLCTWLASDHPKKRLPERDHVELLLAVVPPTATVNSIIDAMLAALGDPLTRRGSVSLKTARIITLCKNCGVELLLFDESQHLYDRGKTTTRYMLGDWIKYLIDKLGIPTVLLGLPRTENLLQVNDQLRRRFSRRIHLAMGQSESLTVEEECLQLFLSLVSLLDVSVKPHPYTAQEMGERLYLSSDGRVAYIKKLLFAAYRHAIEQELDAVDAQLLERAFTEEIWWEGIGKLNPFNPGFALRRLDRRGEPFEPMPHRIERIKK